MSRAWRIAATLFPTLALAALCACQRPGALPAASTDPREIVALVTIEGLGRYALAGAPADAAPFLRSLGGDQGGDVYTPSPATVPALVSVMTGKSPSEHGVVDAWSGHVRADQQLLAERMGELGYRTAAFVANPLLGRSRGLDRGFEVFDGSTASFFGTDRHYPEVRRAGGLVDDAALWLASLPAGARAFLWMHLSDLGEPRLESMTGTPPPALERLTAVDNALRRLRDAIATGSNRGRLIVAGDRGLLRTEAGDVGQGFFLEPSSIRVYFAEQTIGSAASPGASRPRSLVELFAAVTGASGASPESSSVVSVSAIPWLWCRWPAAVAVEQGGVLYVRDGSWGRAEGPSLGAVKESDVPPEVRALAGHAAAALEKPPPPVADPSGLQSALRGAGLTAGATALRPAPAREQRLAKIATLQRARLEAALGNAPGALERLRPLTRGPDALLVAQLDTLMIDALRGGRAEAGWEAGREVLARQGEMPQALHWMAHVALLRGERTLAETLLRGYLDQVPRDPDALYDLACMRSLAGDAAGAQARLRAAVDAGFNQWRMLDVDPDLRSLRADPGYPELRKSFGR